MQKLNILDVSNDSVYNSYWFASRKAYEKNSDSFFYIYAVYDNNKIDAYQIFAVEANGQYPWSYGSKDFGLRPCMTLKPGIVITVKNGKMYL